MNPTQPRQEQTAVVIGASMAGILAARVLTDHYTHVKVIERDHLPSQPGPRNGVPQARHAHLLLLRGSEILEQLFPGLVPELVAEGAVALDPGVDLAGHFPTGWVPKVPIGRKTVSCTRDLLEFRTRACLAKIPGVEILTEREAVGLERDAAANRVTAVRTRARGDKREEGELAADLVVDASGRSSHITEWLREMGCHVPTETSVNAFLGYASRIFAVPEGRTYPWKALLVQADAPRLGRGGVILPLEGKRWIVTLAGYGRDFPPTQEAGYMDFAKSLGVSDLYEAIRDAEPLSPISGYQRTENLLRHYENVPDLPQNLYVIGDAVCAFNPVYGQGMANAAISALTLDKELGSGDAPSGTRFQKRLAKQNEIPWLMATTEDYRYPTTEGPPLPLGVRLSQGYLKRVIRTTPADPEVFRVFVEALHLVTPPTALFAPGIAFRVARHSLFPSSPSQTAGG